MFAALRHSVRLVKVGLTLARHDALFPLEIIGRPPLILRLVRWIAKLRFGGDHDDARRPGERLADALQELGPSFIKFGQALATRADLVGAGIARDLGALQDKLPPFPGIEAQRIIESELGRPIAEIFPVFDPDAVAAASIAQVHFAETADGQRVAVKILRPNVEEAFARDLESFRWLARLIERRQPALRRLRPTDVVENFARTVAMEMDLRYEAAAASELRENLSENPYFGVPAVHWPQTAQRVLTLERIDGLPMGNRAALVDAGLDLPAMARHVVQGFLEQALFHGFFHADLHQGNLFAMPGSRIVAVDFGIVGRLDEETRRHFAEILYGFLHRDYAAVAEAHFRAGYVPPDQSRAAFAQALRAIGEPIADRPTREISFGALLAQLLRTTERFSMQTQPQLLLLQKTMVMVEGVSSHLDPQINMWEAARPVIERWIREKLGAQARIIETLRQTIMLAERLPRLVEDHDSLIQEIRARGLPLQARAEVRKDRPRHWRDPLLLAVCGLAGGLVGGLIVLAIS